MARSSATTTIGKIISISDFKKEITKHQCSLSVANWEKITKSLKESDSKKLTVGFSTKIDASESKITLKTEIRFSVSHMDSRSSSIDSEEEEPVFNNNFSREELNSAGDPEIDKIVDGEDEQVPANKDDQKGEKSDSEKVAAKKPAKTGVKATVKKAAKKPAKKEALKRRTPTTKNAGSKS